MPENPKPGELGIDVEYGAEQILIRAQGEVDLSNAARLQETINSACEREAHATRLWSISAPWTSSIPPG